MNYKCEPDTFDDEKQYPEKFAHSLCDFYCFHSVLTFRESLVSGAGPHRHIDGNSIHYTIDSKW